jgi:3-methyl-2-oxobutanoate hydroxymethyltransferase
MAKLAEEAGIDIILLGDSIANVMFGYESTLPAKFDVMLEHAKAVRRGAPTAFLIGDMPFMTYQASLEEAIRKAGLYMQEADVDCVKLEGGLEVVPVVKALVAAGIPVWGHTGLTPQSVKMLGGYKAQGRGADVAFKLTQAVAGLAQAGAFAITAEAIPVELGKVLYERASDYLMFSVGCGQYTDGPIINLYDMLGFYDHVPRFAKKYGDIRGYILGCLKTYVEECENRTFPGPEHCYYMKEGEPEKFLKMMEEAQAGK